MRIFLTGASSGIGAALRTHLIERGHQVYGCGVGGPEAHYDFRHLGAYAIKQIWQKAQETMDGPIDVLINNAGITRIDYIENQLQDDFNDVLNVNLQAPWLFCREMVKQVVEEEKEMKNSMYGWRKERRILNVSSMGATIGLRCSIPYCVSKAGLEAMTRTLAKETAGRLPLTVAAIAFSGIDDTEMQKYTESELVTKRGMTPSEAYDYYRNNPMKRNMSHAECLEMFTWAIESMPEACSGTVLHCPMGSGI